MYLDIANNYNYMYVEANHVAEKKIILNSPQCIVAILNSSPIRYVQGMNSTVIYLVLGII